MSDPKLKQSISEPPLLRDYSEVEGLKKSKPKLTIKVGNVNKEIPERGLKNKIKSIKIPTSLSSSEVIGLKKKPPSLLPGNMGPIERI